MSWRGVTVSDIKGLLRVADAVHPDLPESEEVFSERVALFPEGCLVLVETGQICGYAISHPIRRRHLPALDSRLGQIAADADEYYIHDVAILPALRGCGLAAECVGRLLDVAGRYLSTCLVSVYGTTSFWSRFGFVPVAADVMLAEKLRGYGADAVLMSRKN